MATPITTIFPVPSLPSCVTACGSLYDVNGKCVPPNTATADAVVYGQCFCDDPRLTAFSTGATGVCDGACAATSDLGSIQGWYSSFCGSIDAVAVTTSSSGAGSTSSGAPSSSSNNGGGGTWLSTHYQWVIFLVIMVFGVIAIWVGACFWRRRYIRKKDRQYALGRNLARATESGRIVPNASQAGSIHVPPAGVFMPAPITSAGVYGEKERSAPKKKWIVKERT